MVRQTRRRFLKLSLATTATGLSGGGAGDSAAATEIRGSTQVLPSLAQTPALPAPVPFGEWRQLTFASIARRQLGSVARSAKRSFDPTPALAVEALPPSRSSAVPLRAFCRATMGEPGVLYYHGSLHSDYPGNEIDRIDLRDLSASTVGLSINHQPNIPPGGAESGYGAGSGAYIYRQYGTGLADNSQWQPYTFHNWCFNTWHPAHGYLLWSVYAVGDGTVAGADPSGSGRGYVQSSMLYYTAPNDHRQRGFVRYYENTKYELASLFPRGAVMPLSRLAGTSDYNRYRQSIIALFCDSWSLAVYELVSGTWQLRDNRSVASITGVPGSHFPFGKDGNGTLVQSLDENRFLWFCPNGMAWPGRGMDHLNWSHQVYVYDVAANTHTRVMLGANIQAVVAKYLPISDLCLSFAVDKSARLVYCCTVDGTREPGGGTLTGLIRVWRAGFDDLGVWTELSFNSVPTVKWNCAIDREPLKVFNGHLFFLGMAGGGFVNLHRVKVTQGEAAPAFSFTRHDYATQSYTLPAPHGGAVLSCKHVNHAYRTANGRYYQMAGDISKSFTQSMYTLSVSPSAYNFAHELDETTPAPVGYVRPATTDDGAWAYCGAGNSNPALADKFIWMRGGDGAGYRSNVLMQTAYANDAAVIADRWTLKKGYVYDPVNHRFTDAGIEDWPVDKGGLIFPHPKDWPSAFCRNGAFDKTTNTFFRFGGPGHAVLTAYNFDTRRIRIWNTGSWYHPTSRIRIFMDATYPSAGAATEPDAAYPGLYWFDASTRRYRSQGEFWQEHQAVWVDEMDGKLYVVSVGTGYLWCFETRGTEVDAGGANGLNIPFYPVGKRLPLTRHYENRQRGVGTMGSYLVPFKGGLFWTTDTPSGNSGAARYCYWRRLGYAGDWTPITLPADWAANSFGAKSTGIDNAEVLAIGAFQMAGNASNSFYLIT